MPPGEKKGPGVNPGSPVNSRDIFQALDVGFSFAPGIVSSPIHGAMEITDHIIKKGIRELQDPARFETQQGTPEAVQPAVGANKTQRIIQGGPKIKRLPAYEQKAGKQKAPAMYSATITPGMTPEEAQQTQDLQQQEWLLRYNAGLATMKAGVVKQEALKDFAFVAQESAEALANLVDNEFPKYHKKLQEFEKELDDISSMRVNPYRYLQRANAGGRAGAILATAVSQLSAGAGQINTASRALESVINRDISAQMTDIELAYKGVAAKKENLADQVALMEEMILFRDKALAYSWTAVSSIIAAAEQGAMNEASYIGLHLWKNLADQNAIAAKVAERAKMGTLYIEGPVKRAKDMLQWTQLAIQSKAILEQTFARGAVSGQAEAIAQQRAGTMEGQVSQPAAGQQRPTMGQASQRGTAKPSVAARRKTQKAAPQEAQQAYYPPPGSAARQELNDTLAKSPIKPQRDYYERAISGFGGDPVLEQQLRDAGSYSREMARQRQDIVEDHPTYKQVEEVLLNPDPEVRLEYFKNPERAGGGNLMFSDIRDAKAMANEMRDVLYDFSNKRNKEWIEYINEYPELLLGDIVVTKDGEEYKNTYVDAGPLGVVKLTMRGLTKVEQVEESAAEMGLTMERIRRAAQAVSATTVSKNPFIAVVNGNIEFLPVFSADAQAAQQNLDNALTDLSVRWIKERDPSGRLSDQDLKLARAMIAAALDSKTLKVADLADSLFNGNTSAVREGIKMFLMLMAADQRRSFLNKNKNLIALPYDAWEEQQQDEEELARMINRRIEQQENSGNYTFRESWKSVEE